MIPRPSHRRRRQLLHKGKNMILGYFLLVAIICGLAAAPLRTPKHLTAIRHPSLLILAGIIQLPVLAIGRPYSGPILGVLLVSLWALDNRHLPGVKILLIGVMCNGLAMLAHQGAMPLKAEVAQQLGLALTPHVLLPGSKDVIAQHGVWMWLGDWIVLPLPSAVLVLSPGDLAIVAALGRWVWACRQAAPKATPTKGLNSVMRGSVVRRWVSHPH